MISIKRENEANLPRIYSWIMKRFLYILLFFVSFSAICQEFEVASFEILQNDLSARTEPRIDKTGVPCALIKVYVKDKITELRGSYIGEPIDYGMEKWIYVVNGCKEIEILFEEHYPLHYSFIESNIPVLTQQMTYRMKLREKPEDSQPVAVYKSSDETYSAATENNFSSPVVNNKPSKETVVEEKPAVASSFSATKEEMLYGFFDGEKVFNSMPAYDKIQRELNEMADRFNKEFERKRKAVDAKFDLYQTSPSEALLNEISIDNQELTSYMEDKQKELENFKDKEQKKLEEELFKMIAVVSREEGFVFVVEQGKVVYKGKNAVDITEKLISRFKN